MLRGIEIGKKLFTREGESTILSLTSRTCINVTWHFLAIHIQKQTVSLIEVFRQINATHCHLGTDKN